MRRLVLVICVLIICGCIICGCAESGTSSIFQSSVVIQPASQTSVAESSSQLQSSVKEIQSTASQKISSQNVSSLNSSFPNVSSQNTSPVTLTVSSDEISPGEFLVIRVEGSEDNALWVRFSDVTSKVFALIKEDGYFFGFLPLSSTTDKTGKVQILRSKSGEYVIIAQKPIEFIARTFERQDITVVSGSSMADSGSSENLDDDNKVIAGATESSPQKLLFTGGFVMPAEGRISTQYGMRRYTNGKYSSAHSGYDIAADEGDPVIATGAGHISYAGKLKFYGNTVIIAHGFNIFSYYNHLSVLSVETGQTVLTGEKIGEVGSTGYATGPHLHFNIKVNGVNIDPAVLIGTDDIYTQLERMINQ